MLVVPERDRAPPPVAVPVSESSPLPRRLVMLPPPQAWSRTRSARRPEYGAGRRPVPSAAHRIASARRPWSGRLPARGRRPRDAGARPEVRFRGPVSSRRPPRCRLISVQGDRCSVPGLRQCRLPSKAVGHDMQQPLAVGHVVQITWPDGLPGVASRIGCRNTKHGQQPVPPVGAMVGQRLAGPLTGDQDPSPGVAEVLAAMGLALAGPRPQARPGVGRTP